MKKIIAMIMALALALSLTLTSACAETAEVDTDAIFAEAAAQLLGNNLELIGLVDEEDLGVTKLYSYLCRMTPVVPDAETQLAFLLVATEIDGKAVPMTVLPCPLTDLDGNLEAPNEEIVLEQVVRPVAELPAGTAGSSLQAARFVCSLWQACALYPMNAVDTAALQKLAEDAKAALTVEEKAAFEENAPGIFAEFARLVDPAEELGGLYADAGCAEVMEALRADEAACASAAALAEAVR